VSGRANAIGTESPDLELNDIQAGVLRPRPSPYAGTYVVLRIDWCSAGHELLKRLLPIVASAAAPSSRAVDMWVSVVLSYQGLRAITPWRCTEEHRPLGNIQRARKEVYRQSSLLRHDLNYQVRREPKDLAEIFGV
jgi:hypothetical protein